MCAQYTIILKSLDFLQKKVRTWPNLQQFWPNFHGKDLATLTQVQIKPAPPPGACVCRIIIANLCLRAQFIWHMFNRGQNCVPVSFCTFAKDNEPRDYDPRQPCTFGKTLF
jgi:hypothetical protein